MAEYVNVAVDAMGGDNAPTEIVKGAVEAVNADKRVKVFLVGKEPVIREELKAYTYDAEQLEVVHAEEVIETEEIPEKESSEHQLVMHSIKEQCAIAVDELVEELNRLGRQVIFLGDGVPVYREQILQKLKVPCSFAPAANNRQRAASVASLGAVYYAHGRTVTAAEHEPEYLRKSQAEREREEQEKVAKEAQA